MTVTIAARALYFNPRSPQGGATEYIDKYRDNGIFQSTLPARGSDAVKKAGVPIGIEFQSTLPARGSDQRGDNSPRRLTHFNPRSPQGGATPALWPYCIDIYAFQSTLPARGSDHRASQHSASQHRNFNPRSPQGGATSAAKSRPPMPLFQSTLPTRGSDGYRADGRHRHRHFNPRSPRGGATLPCGIPVGLCGYFNPRSPRGGATALR